ncbi:S-adenosyl-L-methionine-dependent methyltransferase [Xylariomycetidae sp. FL0641]|nr:S-adenosyl-L-methionine-dependent methyltransferase [Xylariomycetidae sp. FL0641]
MSHPRITDLSARIAANTAKVNEYLATHDLPRPGFDLDAPPKSLIPPTEPEIAQARQDPMLGPREHLTSFRHNELIDQHAIARFRLAEAFPLGGETTFAELAAESGLNEVHVRKLLRFAMTQHIFHEPRPGFVAHTAASHLLAEDKGLYNWIRFSTNDLWHAAYHTGNAIPGFLWLTERIWPCIGFFAENPEREQRFGAAMRFFTERPGLEPVHVVNGYPWNKLPEDGTVVDVGGSHGIICIELARRFSTMRLVVQDLDEKLVREAEKQCPSELAGRVQFMAQDFFTPQPIHGADVYFLRAILHNWPNTYAVKILRNLVPALKPGAKIVLNEPVIPEPDQMPPGMAGRFRGNDLIMLELQNGGDREMGEWEALVHVRYLCTLHTSTTHT